MGLGVLYLCTLVKDGGYLHTSKKFARTYIPLRELSFTCVPFLTDLELTLSVCQVGPNCK